MVYILIALKIYYEELRQHTCQEANGVTQRTVYECPGEVAKEKKVAKCLDDNNNKLTYNNHQHTIVDVNNIKVQRDIGENIDDDRRAKHHHTPFT